jgi:hypothetical protein
MNPYLAQNNPYMEANPYLQTVPTLPEVPEKSKPEEVWEIQATNDSGELSVTHFDVVCDGRAVSYDEASFEDAVDIVRRAGVIEFIFVHRDGYREQRDVRDD